MIVGTACPRPGAEHGRDVRAADEEPEVRARARADTRPISGLFQEEIQNGVHGTYAQEGFLDFTFDVAVGDVALPVTAGSRGGNDNTFDSWARPVDSRTDTTQDKDKSAKDPKEVTDQPYEKVKIKVTFPTLRIEKEEQKHELVLEQWIPWKQVYGSNELDSGDAQKGGAGTASSSTKPASGGTSK